MDTKRLEAFLKVVDLGSVTRAANVLNVAQPALSQQIASLEVEFKKQLLIRSTRGVTPTEAGQILYRYAQMVQRQIEEARRSILDSGAAVSGNVTVGLAPLSTASLIAPALLREVRSRFPGIVLNIFDSFGVTLSEMTLKGRMDMAVLYGDTPVRGLSYTRLFDEPFYLVAAPAFDIGGGSETAISVSELAKIELVLPARESYLRQAIERACSEAGVRARVVAEIHALPTLATAVLEGMAATVLPWPIASTLLVGMKPVIRRIASASASLPMSLGIPDNVALSDAAFAVYGVLNEQIQALKARWPADHRESL
ncbi:LysR family nitrogen assimilation transcriptional regulator [Bosea sp. BE125]|uniref:LysR substrate-binding domain-containing protein n=1 Tax=Bosea sp. BE125 TaxID=2817909 RepID=UPI00285EC6CB|nr:LysR substrate-binding domain-containing protein [Bosea sp. BE125]MDR6871760.1 LysR family nitrogen assimilation transcriptional regulator [Bosea sp. BE125]